MLEGQSFGGATSIAHDSRYRGIDHHRCVDRQPEHREIDPLRGDGGNPSARRQLSGRHGREKNRSHGTRRPALRADRSSGAVQSGRPVAGRNDRRRGAFAASGRREAGRRRVCIVDASNLERHLYLLSQVLELGLPTVVAVNMLDVAASRGIKLELRHLQNRLGVPVVPIQANRGKGVAEIKAALMEVLHSEAAAGILAFSRGLRRGDPRPAIAPGNQRMPLRPSAPRQDRRAAAAGGP